MVQNCQSTILAVNIGNEIFLLEEKTQLSQEEMPFLAKLMQREQTKIDFMTQRGYFEEVNNWKLSGINIIKV